MGGSHGVVWRYGLALAAVAVATGFRYAFDSIVGTYAPYLPFVLALTVVSFFGGRGPGLFTSALSLLSVDWFFLEPRQLLAIKNPAESWAFGLFTVTAIAIALLVGSLREALLTLKTTEGALRKQAQLIDLSHDAVITLDRQRRILKWNKGAAELYGWTEREAAGNVLHELLRARFPVSIPEIDEVLRRKGRWDGEITHTTRDGSSVTVDSRQVLFEGEAGQPECILAINRDITEHKRMDEALRASKARFQLVLEAANVGVWDLDLSMHATWRSPQHDAIFGYPALLPEWNYEMFLDHVLAEDREEVRRKVQQALEAGAADLQFECRIRRADGAVRWIGVAGRSVLDPHGRQQRLYGIVQDISARKQMEEDLRQSEDQFRTLANAIPQLCGMAHPDGRFFWTNQRWCDYTGLKPEQSFGWDWLSAIDVEASSAALESWRRSIAAGEPFESVFEARGTDGVLRPFLAIAMPLRNRAGEVVRWFATMTDISEQRKTEEALRRAHSEELARLTELQAIMDAAPVAMFLSRDPRCLCVLGNRRAYDLFRERPGINLSPTGGEASACLMMRDGRVIPTPELPMQKAAASGQAVHDQELELVCTDGSKATIIGNAVPLLDEEGRATGAIGIFVDITARKQMEESLQQAHREERARATELQAIMDAAPIAMCIARDPECRFVIGNQAAYTLLHMPPGSNLSKSAPDDQIPTTFQVTQNGSAIPADELPLQKAAATGKGVCGEESELVFPDGSRSNIIGNAVPLFDAEGRSTGAVGIFIDITERKRTEERLRQAQKMESIGLLAGGIAHDFNNLLTVILGSADFALRRYPECGELRQVITSSERAAHLTRQLLAYAGKGQFLSETFDLSELVLRCKELLSASIPKGVKLRFALSHEGLPIRADSSQIEQVLVNLVINAGEAIPPETDGRIEVATSICVVPPEEVTAQASAYDAQAGPYVCLEVSDNGCGMDPETVAKIFDPFFSTKFTGRGLGLAAVQGIVRSCHGFIEVQSSPGAGSKFVVHLPLAAEKAISSVRATAGLRPRARGPATILVVEDEEMVRELACAALRDGGYGALEANDAKSALETLAGAASPPSVLLLDLTLPAMAAGELVPILNQKYPELRIIVTGDYPEEEARRGFLPGAVAGYLQKPYTVATLIETVERTLNGGPGEDVRIAA